MAKILDRSSTLSVRGEDKIRYEGRNPQTRKAKMEPVRKFRKYRKFQVAQTSQGGKEKKTNFCIRNQILYI